MNKHITPLTAEETQQTLTFFFPRDRDETTPPEVTVMIRRTAEHEWHAGMSVCSRKDMFEKKEGRVRAFGRLKGRPIETEGPYGEAAGWLGDTLASICETVNKACERVKGPDGKPVGNATISQLSSARFAKRLETMKIHPLNPCAEIEVAQ